MYWYVFLRVVCHPGARAWGRAGAEAGGGVGPCRQFLARGITAVTTAAHWCCWFFHRNCMSTWSFFGVIIFELQYLVACCIRHVLILNDVLFRLCLSYKRWNCLNHLILQIVNIFPSQKHSCVVGTHSHTTDFRLSRFSTTTGFRLRFETDVHLIPT